MVFLRIPEDLEYICLEMTFLKFTPFGENSRLFRPKI